MSGYLSNLSYSVKRLTFVLFVNGRLVDSPALRQAVTATYARHLPRHGHGWVYMSVEVAKDEVDVNVHPTKREVSVLHEDELLALVERAMDDALKGSQNSRTFYTTPLLPARGATTALDPTPADDRKEAGEPVETAEDDGDEDGEWKEEGGDAVVEEGEAPDTVFSLTQIGREKRVYRPNKLVRTDARQGKLPSYFTQHNTSSHSHTSASTFPVASPAPPHAPGGSARKRSRQPTTELTSVHAMLAAVRASESAGLVDLFSAHTFVGVVDGQYSLLQYKTGLYLVDHARVSEALFYQRILSSFSTHATMTLDPPVPCAGMLEALGPARAAGADMGVLVRFAGMLREYWGVGVTREGELTSVPDLLPHYTPPWVALPLLLRALCVEVDWTEEERCLKGVSMALAHWYRVQPGMYVEERKGGGGGEEKDREQEGKEGDEEEEEKGLSPQLGWCLEHSLFPACRHGFSPPQSFLSDGTITQVASLEQLYKTFERC